MAEWQRQLADHQRFVLPFHGIEWSGSRCPARSYISKPSTSYPGGVVCLVLSKECKWKGLFTLGLKG